MAALSQRHSEERPATTQSVTFSHGDKTVTSYLDGKLIVIKPTVSDHDNIIVPFICGLCEYPMKQAQDAESYRTHGCCAMCSLHWRQHGIQPDKNSDLWHEYVSRRRLAWRPNVTVSGFKDSGEGGRL